MVDLLKESVESYEKQADKSNYTSRVALGQMQMFVAEIEKNIGVSQSYANIMKADSETAEKYAQAASAYNGETVTVQDLKSNKNGIAEQMAIRDWINGVLMVNMDIVAEAEIADFQQSLSDDGANNAEYSANNAENTRFSLKNDAKSVASSQLKNQLQKNAQKATVAQQKALAAEISNTEFDNTKRVQNVHVADGNYISMRRNADGTYSYSVKENGKQSDGKWNATNVSEQDMVKIYNDLKQGASEYAAQNGENAAPANETEEKKKPRQKTEIDQETAEKISKFVKDYNSLSYRDRNAIARMVKSAEKAGVDTKVTKGVAVAMSTRRGLDIRFSTAIAENGAWTIMEKSGRRLILINPSTSQALKQTVLHEYLHDIMGDSEKTANAVIHDTEAAYGKEFKEYIDANRDAYFDAQKKAGNTDLITTTAEDGTVTRSFASKNAEAEFNQMMREEAAANFGAKMLDERGYLDRLAESNRKGIVKAWNKLKQWISDVRTKDLATARLMERYTQSIAKYVGTTYAVESTMATMVEQKGSKSIRMELSESDVPRVSIDDNAELSAYINNSNKSKYDAIRMFLIEKFENQTFNMSDGRIAIMDRSDAQKLSNRANQQRTAQLGNLKEIVELARYDHSATNIEHRKFTEFHYYAISVEYDGVEYGLWINVGTTKNDGKDHIYSITNRKEETPTKTGVARPVGYALQNVSSKDSIQQNSENVNRKSKKTRFELAETILTSEQRDALKKRNVNGDAYLNAADLASDILSVGGEITNDAKAILYHGTTSENAKKIRETGKMYGKEDALFFSTKKDGIVLDYGNEVAEVRIPLEKLQLNDVFDDEMHLTMQTKPNTLTNIRFSLPETDSDGKTISAEQRKYFSGTKVVDEQGRLLTVYHGSPKTFTEFSHRFMNTHGNAHGRGFYFTENMNYAEGYRKDGGQLLKGYLDIKNPASETQTTMRKSELVKLVKAICEAEAKDYVSEGSYDNMHDALLDTWVSNYADTYNAYSMDGVYKQVADIVMQNDNDVDILAELTNAGAGAERVLSLAREVIGYDGIIYDNGDGTHQFVAFESNQFKNADNVTPTKSKDIRFELAEKLNAYTDKEIASIKRDAKNEVATSYDDVERFIEQAKSANEQKRNDISGIQKRNGRENYCRDGCLRKEKSALFEKRLDSKRETAYFSPARCSSPEPNVRNGGEYECCLQGQYTPIGRECQGDF